jgi:dTDP-4-dehydrorhamnose reductase
MKVVVTGRDGQVASCLAERSSSQRLFDFTFLGRKELDLTDPAGIMAALDTAHPDVVVSAAAFTAVDLAEDEPELAHIVNAAGPKAIANWCRKNGARMIHLSTDYVFAGIGDAAHVETDPVDPRCVYGSTKLAGEVEIRRTLRDHAILRTAWLYSPYGKNFVKTILKFAATRRSINVVSDQFGNPTSALDLADAILALMTDWQAGGRIGLGKTYHVAGTGSTNWADLATFVYAASEKAGGPYASVNPVKTEEYQTRVCRPANSRLDCSKFFADFGWRAPEWRKSVAEVVSRLIDKS